ncbi:1-aminocyclopropane-1-carboxylate deaminase/D-cysteine desulfhydrase [Acinetobacter sp. CAAS 2-6]|uniref:1-aminocyclopropane-1-carboxylate deaminase/D-cysteine desulfhydrase n=1 Tax=Acinetobacter sp. CAAS 2-6 TaxID=3016358 RepID=UPI003FA37002
MFTLSDQQLPYHNIPAHPDLRLDIKRLDLIHPLISGNKFYKLKDNIRTAQQQGYQQLLTFGGAYSNHIAATAAAGKLLNIPTIGIIRGEELEHQALNPTLTTAQQNGMQLHFVSRQEYRQRHEAEYLARLSAKFPYAYIIPEGGTNTLAVQGCQEILSEKDLQTYDVICCAVGTGGTISGLINASAEHQQVIGFPALKGDFLIQDIQHWTKKSNWLLVQDYHFGGYAKVTPALLDFIQRFEQQYQIPLEPIYTGKMLFGLFELIKQNYFVKGSRILVIHSGGLQGKTSLS